ncbi:Transposase DDE domain-containing protein, partial [Anaerovirgula multivorans]
QRQMIVEHPFGTIKRGLGMTYFLTKGMQSVKSEISFAFLAYNMKRALNILGIKEIMRRLTGILKNTCLFIMKPMENTME